MPEAGALMVVRLRLVASSFKEASDDLMENCAASTFCWADLMPASDALRLASRPRRLERLWSYSTSEITPSF